VAILRKKKGDLNDDGFAHMRKVTGYVKRHHAQRPKQEDVEDSLWRYSLMNWGHDPLSERLVNRLARHDDPCIDACRAGRATRERGQAARPGSPRRRRLP